MTPRGRSIIAVMAAFAAASALAGCGTTGADGRPKEAGQSRTGLDEPGGVDIGKMLGGGGGKAGPAGIGVNSFLWRASLDTLSFMPLASADPYGGVITTDWYADPNKPDERFKATVYILDTRLRADGLKVAIFKQKKAGADWITAEVDPDTAVQIENAILTRARQLKLAAVPSGK